MFTSIFLFRFYKQRVFFIVDVYFCMYCNYVYVDKDSYAIKAWCTFLLTPKCDAACTAWYNAQCYSTFFYGAVYLFIVVQIWVFTV